MYATLNRRVCPATIARLSWENTRHRTPSDQPNALARIGTSQSAGLDLSDSDICLTAGRYIVMVAFSAFSAIAMFLCRSAGTEELMYSESLPQIRMERFH